MRGAIVGLVGAFIIVGGAVLLGWFADAFIHGTPVFP